MKAIFKRKNAQFVIDKTQLQPVAQKLDVMNALYAAVYTEFRGAVDNPKYENMTSLQKYNALNTFAENWLKERGLE